MHIPDELKFTENFLVSNIIHNGSWNIPTDLERIYPVVTEEISEVLLSEAEEDELIWAGSTNGEITVNEASELYREKVQIIKWRRDLWRPFIPLQISLFCMEN